MSASEIRSNEIEGNRTPERETPSPSELDKTKLQPSEHPDGNASGARDEANDGLKKNESEHPKLNNSEAHEGEHSNPKQGQEVNEHPKIDTGNENKPANKGESPEETKVPEVENSRNNQPEDSASKENNKPKENVSEGRKDAQKEGASGEGGKPKEDAPEGEGGKTDKPEDGASGEGSKPKEDAPEGENGTANESKESPQSKGDSPNAEAQNGEEDKPKGFGEQDYDYLTPDERAYLNSLYDKGELQPTTEPSTDVPKEPRQHLPAEKTGHFTGERGNSSFYPNSEDARDKMADYGKDSVEYKNGSPDFEPFSTHDSPWGKVDTGVEIPHMTDQRGNPIWEYGRRPEGTSHDPNYDLGNFAQADNALRDKINASNPDHPVTSDDIEAWRKDNGLTWHELDDGKTMMLVPTEIHDACPHSGGVAEMRTNMAYGNYEPDNM